MFIKMGNVYVLMKSIETVRVVDDWLTVTTARGDTFHRPCNKLEKNKTLENLLNKLCEIQGGNNEATDRHGQDGECAKCRQQGEETGVPVSKAKRSTSREKP